MADAIDNSEIVVGFVPETDDGDTFLYTELIDRSKRAGGSNRMRVLRTFFHVSRDDFWRRWPTIKTLCEQTGVRAYTRLAPRSFAAVGKLATERYVGHALAGNFKGLRYVYASACGSVTPISKLWLFDVDEPTAAAARVLRDCLEVNGKLVATIPSRKGHHLISQPFDVGRTLPGAILESGISLHKDNPTNLFIPAERDDG